MQFFTRRILSQFMALNTDYSMRLIIQNTLVMLSQATLVAADFWGDGILTCFLSFFGICGNILTILVFSQKDLRSTFHANLTILAFFDLGFTTICWINAVLKLTDGKKVRSDFIKRIQNDRLLFNRTT